MNEQFEKWLRSKYPDAWLHRLAGSSDYMVPNTQYMWEAWQASRAGLCVACRRGRERRHPRAPAAVTANSL